MSVEPVVDRKLGHDEADGQHRGGHDDEGDAPGRKVASRRADALLHAERTLEQLERGLRP